MFFQAALLVAWFGAWFWVVAWLACLVPLLALVAFRLTPFACLLRCFVAGLLAPPAHPPFDFLWLCLFWFLFRFVRCLVLCSLFVFAHPPSPRGCATSNSSFVSTVFKAVVKNRKKPSSLRALPVASDYAYHSCPARAITAYYAMGPPLYRPLPPAV